MDALDWVRTAILTLELSDQNLPSRPYHLQMFEHCFYCVARKSGATEPFRSVMVFTCVDIVGALVL
eukprot:294093-Amphidinium_carterae.1